MTVTRVSRNEARFFQLSFSKLENESAEEFQAAFYANNQGCPAPCSFDLPESFHGTCTLAVGSGRVDIMTSNDECSKMLQNATMLGDGANWDVRVVHSTKEASELRPSGFGVEHPGA